MYTSQKSKKYYLRSLQESLVSHYIIFIIFIYRPISSAHNLVVLHEAQAQEDPHLQEAPQQFLEPEDALVALVALEVLEVLGAQEFLPHMSMRR